MLVCDRDGPTGIAGIMGGQVSEVSDTTTRVLLEVATWNGVNILRTSRKLGLRSDASNRNEKQLHPELALRGQRVASQLLVELCGARLVPGTIDVTGEIPDAHRLRLRGGRAERVLGLAIPFESQAEYLRRLEFEVAEDGADLEATVPFHRHYDVTREIDLVEEVGRIHGYAEHLPPTLPPASAEGGGLSREQRLRRRAEDLARDLGFDGIVTLASPTPGSRSGCGSRRRRPARADDRDLEPALRASTRCCARRCSAACSTSPATTSPTALAGWRCTSPGAPTCATVSPSAGARSAAPSPACARRPHSSPGGIACLASGSAAGRRVAGR